MRTSKRSSSVRLKRPWIAKVLKFRTLGLFSMVVLAGMIALASLPASAHQDPADCNASGLQQFPSIGPGGSVYDNTTLTYSVIYMNTDPDGAGAVAPCNITGADATIMRPDGTIIDVLVDASLNVGDSVSCPGGPGCAAGPYTYVVNHADENGGGSSVTTEFDIAGVLHQDADEEVASDHDTLSKTVIHPSTLLTKNVDDNVVSPGTMVTYTYTETNDGDVPLTSPSVVDDTCAPVNGVDVAPADGFNDGDVNMNGVLDPSEVWTYTCSMVINSDTTNIATGRGLDPNGNIVTWCEDPQNPPQGFICDQDERASTSVRVVLPLVVEKTAETRYQRRWDWTIDKRADQTSLLLAEGEAPFAVNYEVQVSPVSTDFDHMIVGTITITNPVGNPSATIESVSDVVSNVGAANVNCPETFPFVLAGGGVLVCTYDVSAPDGDNETNTATVTTSGDVPGGQGQAAVTFGDPANVVDECIMVSDTNPQGPQNVQVCASDVDKTLEYVVTFGNHPDANVFVECGETDHPNVASFVTNDTQSVGNDNWNVHITVDCFQGCTLTPGYWKTHNASFPGGAPEDDNWENIGDWDLDTVFENEDEILAWGITWYDAFWTAPQGRVWYQLAHHWMAAYLNQLNGASVPAEVQTALNDGWTWLANHNPATKYKGAMKAEALSIMSVLAQYNEGTIGPGHCDEQNPV